jgi:hypothetical protein
VWQQRGELFDVVNAVRQKQGLDPLMTPLDIDGLGFLPTPIPCTGRNRFLGVLRESE